MKEKPYCSCEKPRPAAIGRCLNCWLWIFPLAKDTVLKVVDEAEDLENHARVLIKHRHTAPEWMWENLARSINRLSAARQDLYCNQKSPMSEPKEQV